MIQMEDNTTQDTEFKPDFFMADVYKKWHRTGFIAVKYWVKEGKVQIEIGTINTSTNALVSSAKAFGDVYEFLAYLGAEIEGRTSLLYPEYPTKILQFFGGTARGKDGPISRVFTTLPWKSSPDSEPDLTARSFSCGVYKGKLMKQGAIQPIYTEKLDLERVKMTMADMAKLYEQLKVQVYSYAVQQADLNEIY